MGILDYLNEDMNVFFSDGTDVIFTNTETNENITLPSLVARVSQHYNPLTGMTEALPVHSITVSKQAFTMEIPVDLTKLTVEWVGVAHEKIKACVKEERPTNSMGMITFLCQMELRK